MALVQKFLQHRNKLDESESVTNLLELQYNHNGTIRNEPNILKLGYLKDSNAAAYSVDSDIFYVVINLSVRSKFYIITFFLKVVSNCGA